MDKNLSVVKKTDLKCLAFQCDVCHASFVRKEKLSCHIKSIHAGNKTFECLRCERHFKTKYSLKTHNESFHEDKMSNLQ